MVAAATAAVGAVAAAEEAVEEEAEPWGAGDRVAISAGKHKGEGGTLVRWVSHQQRWLVRLDAGGTGRFLPEKLRKAVATADEGTAAVVGRRTTGGDGDEVVLDLVPAELLGGRVEVRTHHRFAVPGQPQAPTVHLAGACVCVCVCVCGGGRG